MRLSNRCKRKLKNKSIQFMKFMSQSTIQYLIGDSYCFSGFIGNVPVMLAKPQTFMNSSGESVSGRWTYKISLRVKASHLNEITIILIVISCFFNIF